MLAGTNCAPDPMAVPSEEAPAEAAPAEEARTMEEQLAPPPVDDEGPVDLGS